MASFHIFPRALLQSEVLTLARARPATIVPPLPLSNLGTSPQPACKGPGAVPNGHLSVSTLGNFLGGGQSLALTNSDIVICSWLRRTVMPGAHMYGPSVGSTGGSGTFFGTGWDDQNRLMFDVWGFGAIVAPAESGSDVNVWVHSCAVWGSPSKPGGVFAGLYRNSVEYLGATAGVTLEYVGTGRINLYGKYDGSCCNFVGQMDEVRFYNTRISAAQVLTAYLTGVYPSTGLIAYYSFGDQAGLTVTDSSGNGKNLAISGSLNTAPNWFIWQAEAGNRFPCFTPGSGTPTVVYKNKIWWFGGSMAPANPTTLVTSLDPNTMTWTTSIGTFTLRAGGQAIVSSGLVYLW